MRKLLASSALIGIALGSSPALAQQAASSAYAVGVNQTVTVGNVVTANVAVGPLAASSGSTPGSYNVPASVASVNQNISLNTSPAGAVNETLSTGLLSSNSTGSSAGASAIANIQNATVTIGSNVAGVPALFNLMTGVITSMSTASAGGVTGSSSIADASLTGSIFGGTTFASSLFASAAPNTILFNLLGLKITLNEQLASGNSITTNAIDIMFTNFVTGTGLKNGNIILGHTQASFSAAGAVPEPSTWAMMLLGFGAIGFAVRRSRKSPQLALQTN